MEQTAVLLDQSHCSEFDEHGLATESGRGRRKEMILHVIAHCRPPLSPYIMCCAGVSFEYPERLRCVISNSFKLLKSQENTPIAVDPGLLTGTRNS